MRLIGLTDSAAYFSGEAGEPDLERVPELVGKLLRCGDWRGLGEFLRSFAVSGFRFGAYDHGKGEDMTPAPIPYGLPTRAALRGGVMDDVPREYSKALRLCDVFHFSNFVRAYLLMGAAANGEAADIPVLEYRLEDDLSARRFQCPYNPSIGCPNNGEWDTYCDGTKIHEKGCESGEESWDSCCFRDDESIFRPQKLLSRSLYIPASFAGPGIKGCGSGRVNEFVFDLVLSPSGYNRVSRTDVLCALACTPIGKHDTLDECTRSMCGEFIRRCDGYAGNGMLPFESRILEKRNTELVYEIGFGIVKKPINLTPSTFTQSVYNFIRDAVAAHRVRVCPTCGRPFIGNTAKREYCSDSCKTQAAQQRRMDAIAMRSRGASVDEVVERYGAHARKWCAQADALAVR